MPPLPDAPRPRVGVLAQSLPDGTGVLVDERTGASFALNPTGVEVWGLCDGTRTPRGIAAVLLERYEVAPAEAQRTVDALLRQLQALGLLVAAGA